MVSDIYVDVNIGFGKQSEIKQNELKTMNYTYAENDNNYSSHLRGAVGYVWE